MKKYIINAIVALIVGCIAMGYLLEGLNPPQIFLQIKGIIPIWIAIGLGCVISYWLFETMIQHLLVHKVYNRCSMWNAFKVVMTGHFFNALTPFATGGQPMQALLMTRQGIPLGTSVSILMTKFIIYQVILIIYSTFVLIAELKFFIVNINGLVYLSLIGFLVNLIVVAFLFIATFNKELLKKISIKVILLFAKLKLIKNKDKICLKILNQIDLFNENIRSLKKQGRLIFQVSALTILQLTVYFMVPYMVYRALGFGEVRMLLIIAAAAFIVMFSSFIPVPGSSGIAEGSFFLFFQLFFPESILPLAILCWRGLTFYLPLVVGGIMTVVPNQKLEYNT